MKTLHRFVLVGSGHVGDVHARVISELENAELAAVIDKNEKVGREYAAKYGCSYYASLQEAIQKEDFSIASICTPSYSHCGIAEEFVKAGKHERPHTALGYKMPVQFENQYCQGLSGEQLDKGKMNAQKSSTKSELFIRRR